MVNIEDFEKTLCDNKDIIKKTLTINKKIKCHIYLIDGMSDTAYVSEYVIKPLIFAPELMQAKNIKSVIDFIDNGFIHYVAQLKLEKTEDCIKDLLAGNAILLFENYSLAYSFDVKAYEKRTISTPETESVLKGAQDSFIENFRTNTAIIRKKIQNPNLCFEYMTLGRQTNTLVALCYIKNIANDELVKGVTEALKKIDTSHVLSTAIIEEALTHNKYSIFPQVFVTERPDKFCSYICDGRVGIVIDNISYCILAPAVFADFFNNPQDNNQSYIITTFIRILRYVMLGAAFILPALYVFATSFLTNLLPAKLIIFLAGTSRSVPYPIFVEIFAALLVFELLIETATTLPKLTGVSLSIIGGLIIGEAAMSSNLITAPVIFAVGLSAVSTYLLPNRDFYNALRLWRAIILVSTVIFGISGLSLSIVLLLYSISSIQSFGVPYIAPFGGIKKPTLINTFIKLPVRNSPFRMSFLNPKNKRKDATKK